MRFFPGKLKKPRLKKREIRAELNRQFEAYVASGAEVEECDPSPDRFKPWSYYSGAGSKRESFVYFIQAGHSGPVKIGVAYDPVARLRDLQVASHEELRLVGVMLGTPAVESALHQKFAELHIRGEWFKPGKQLSEFILRANKRTAEYLNHYGYGTEKVE